MQYYETSGEGQQRDRRFSSLTPLKPLGHAHAHAHAQQGVWPRVHARALPVLTQC